MASGELKKTQRLLSIDTMRGIYIFLAMGITNALGHIDEVCGWQFFRWLDFQNEHAVWHGFRLIDTIFPTFIFISGIVFPFSSAARMDSGKKKGSVYLHVFARAARMVLIGIIYNGLFMDFRTVRFCSVIGRIGVAWMIAALIYLSTSKRITRIAWAAGIFVAYWLVMRYIPAPDFPGAELFSAEGSISCYVDRLLIPKNHIYSALYDPEGIMGCLPAGAACLFGMIVGDYIKNGKAETSPTRKCIYITCAGVVMMAIGWLWKYILPMNKRMYTSSFGCFIAGMGMVIFAALYFIIDIRGIRKWTFFFQVIGCNSLAIFIAKRIVDFNYSSRFFFGSLISLCPPGWSIFLEEIGAVALCWLVFYFLYKKKVFFKV